MMTKTFHAWVVISIILGAGSFAAPPDAGQLLRDQQSQTQRQPAQRLPSAGPAIVTKSEAGTGGLTVLVKSFRFKGYEGLATEEELQAVVKPAIGQSLGVAGLNGLTEKVTQLLHAKGFFLARAYLPKQDVTGGTIEIAILQARSDGKISVNLGEGARVRDSQLKAMVNDVIVPGQPLQERDLERVLLLMNDLPGVSARAVLSPGADAGTTHVTINVAEAPLYSGAVWADNYGNRYTGEWRGNAELSINDPLHLGDQVNVMGSAAQGLEQGRIGYSAPIGSNGLRGDVSFTDMRYNLIGPMDPLDAKGTAQTVDAGIVDPLVRSRNFNLNATAGYEFKRLIDKAQSAELRDNGVNSGTFGINGNCSDSFNGGGFTMWSVSATLGDLDLWNSIDKLDNKLTARTAGVYERYNFSASRMQRLADGLTLTGSYFGQLASGNLDSSEKFSLGGPNGVRAYPVGEAQGDEGHLLSFELQRDLPFGLKWGNVQAIGFADTGHVTLNKNPWRGAITNATGENSYWLSGAGAGFSIGQPGRYSVRLIYAYKLGDNPGRSVTGLDADGRNSPGCFWFMGQVAF